MIHDIEIRVKLGLANKGSPSVPEKLQYRVQRVVMVSDATYGDHGHVRRELQWSYWRDVKRTTGRTDGDQRRD